MVLVPILRALVRVRDLPEMRRDALVREVVIGKHHAVTLAWSSNVKAARLQCDTSNFLLLDKGWEET